MLHEHSKTARVSAQSAVPPLAAPKPLDTSHAKPQHKFKLRYTEKPARLSTLETAMPPAMPPLAAAPPAMAGAMALPAAVTERMLKPALSRRLYAPQSAPEMPGFGLRLSLMGPARGTAAETWKRSPAAAPAERIVTARSTVKRVHTQHAEPELPEFTLRLADPIPLRAPVEEVWMPLPAALPAERIVAAARNFAVIPFPAADPVQPVMGSLALAEPVSSLAADARPTVPEPRASESAPSVAGPMRTVGVVAPKAHKSAYRKYFPEGPEGAVAALPNAESARSLANPVSGTVPAAPPLRLPELGSDPLPTQGMPSAPFAASLARPAAEKAMPRDIPQTPVPTVNVRQPQVPATAQPRALGMAGVMPLEYFCSRGPRVSAHGIGWIMPAMTVNMPRFAAPLSVETVEPLPAAPKEKRKRPAFAEIFTMPEAAKRSTRLREVSKLIAACLVIGALLWYGTSPLRSNHGQVLTAEDSLAASGRLQQQKGLVGRVRAAINDRAEVHLSDGFHDGMAAWGAAPNTLAPGWSRNPEGYVNPGKLALFQPTLRYTDYRVEFFGQIDSKSLDWAVRASDDSNYYAMKFAADGPGPRAVVSMIHYPVVAGKRGPRVVTPLNIMIHERTPYHVAVNVRGDRVTTSIEGEEVDSFVDGALTRGGVGFFADAGEQARLYWVKVSRNEDVLGRVCAFLSGGSSDTAEVLPPSGTPAPGNGIPLPAEHVVLAAGFGLMRRNAFSRISDHRRFFPWRS